MAKVRGRKAIQQEETAPAIKEENALAQYDYGDAGVDAEEFIDESEDTLAFVSQLQGSSDAVNRGLHDKYIDGAVPGMFLDSSTKELYDELNVVIVHRTRVFQKQKKKSPKDKEGRETFQPDHPDVVRAVRAHGGTFGKIPFDDEHIILETFVCGLLLLDESGENVIGQAVTNFQKTKIPPYKSILKRIKLWATKNVPSRTVTLPNGSTAVRKRLPPIWAYRLRMGSVSQTHGNDTSFTITLEPFGGSIDACLIPPGSDMFNLGKVLAEQIADGSKKVDHSKVDDGGVGSSGGGEGDAAYDAEAAEVL